MGGGWITRVAIREKLIIFQAGKWLITAQLPHTLLLPPFWGSQKWVGGHSLWYKERGLGNKGTQEQGYGGLLF